MTIGGSSPPGITKEHMESTAAYKRRRMAWEAEQWPKKHPNGQLIIHRYNSWCDKTRKRTGEIKFLVGFKTTQHRGKGIGRVTADPAGYYMRNAIFNHDKTVYANWRYPRGSRGVTRYETREHFIAGCDRFDVPRDLMEFCLEMHQQWVDSK